MGLPDIYCWPEGPAKDLKDPNYPNNPLIIPPALLKLSSLPFEIKTLCFICNRI